MGSAKERRPLIDGVFVASALTLLVVATLFPPFAWGEEKIATEQERRVLRNREGISPEQLPIKAYSFLFGPSTMVMPVWGYFQGQSIQLESSLRRRLIVDELILEYVLCLLTAAGISTGVRLVSRLFIKTAT